MGANSEISQHYPRTIALDETLVPSGPQFLRLKPGGSPQIRQVALRWMGAGDRAKILAFAPGLPDEDLLFLRSDISDPMAVEDWVKDIERGTTVTLLAEPDEILAGYVSLHVNPLRWTHKSRRDQHQHGSRLAIARPRRRSLHGDRSACRHTRA
jgi:hypothetical protein